MSYQPYRWQGHGFGGLADDDARAAVRQMYIDYLGRDPLTYSAANLQANPSGSGYDREGLEYWTQGYLTNGANAVRAAFEASDEYKRRQAMATPIVTQAEFDEQYYRQQNPDVAAAIGAGSMRSGYEHFLKYGQAEGRRWRRISDVAATQPPVTNTPPVTTQPPATTPTANPLSGLFSSKITLPIIGEVPVVGAIIGAVVLFSMFSGDGRR